MDQMLLPGRLRTRHPQRFADVFYQPAQLIADARRHGVVVRPVDINHSGWGHHLEEVDGKHRAVPNAFLKAKAAIENVKGEYDIMMMIDKEGKVELSLKKDNRKILPPDEFIERTKTSCDFGMKVTFNEPDGARVRKALLKTAYLYCFDLWGYNFVLSWMADNIRKVLAGEMEYPYADVAVFQVDESKPLPEGV